MHTERDIGKRGWIAVLLGVAVAGLAGEAPPMTVHLAGDSTMAEKLEERRPDSRFFEFRSYGPGAHEGPRGPTLSAEAAPWYTPDHVLNGWDPDG